MNLSRRLLLAAGASLAVPTAARAQASALGLPELNIYVYEQHKAGDVDAEEARKGAAAVAHHAINHLYPRL